MKILMTSDITIKTKKGIKTLNKGQVITVPDEKAKALLDKGKAIPLEPITVTDWLERLSESERVIFEERAAIMEYDGKVEREKAEIEAIKQIMLDRVIPGKCDKCIKVRGCMLTRKQRPMCGGPFLKEAYHGKN